MRWDAPCTGCYLNVSRVPAVRPCGVRDIRTRCILLGKGVDARGHGGEGKGKALRIPALPICGVSVRPSSWDGGRVLGRRHPNP